MQKPFIGRSFEFIPEKIGYSVSEIGVRGVDTQGDTFEEALANAHEAPMNKTAQGPPRTGWSPLAHEPAQTRMASCAT